MELKTLFIQDAEGNIFPGANCFLYYAGTSALVPGLVDAQGAPLSNPFPSDIDGMIQFSVTDGLYDLRAVAGGFDRRIRVQFLDVLENMAVAQAAADTATEAAAAAELAADAANATGKIYSTTALGLASGNEYFSVPSPVDMEALILFRNVVGVATEIKRYPSSLVSGIARRGNFIVSGRPTKIEKAVASFDFTVSWGRLYLFTGAGVAQTRIQAVTDLLVPEGKCAYIDLNEAQVAGEYIVHVSDLPLTSSSNPAGVYIDDRKFILFMCSNGIVGGGLYPQYHNIEPGTIGRIVLDTALKNNTDRAGWHVVGRATSITANGSAQVITTPILTVTGGQTFASKPIAPVAALSIPIGEALYVDLDSAPNGSGQLVPQVTSGGYTVGMIGGTYVTDRKVYLFINGTTGIGGPLAQQPITPAFFDAAAKSRTFRGAYQVAGELSKLILSGSSCIVSFNDLRLSRGVGSTSFLIAGATDLTIPTGQALYVDLDSALVGGKLPLQVTTAGYTSATGGLVAGNFVDDNKVYLFINDTLGHGGVLGARKTPLNMYTGVVWLKQNPLSITFDPVTRTLTWDNFLILPVQGGQGRIKLAPGSYTFTTDGFNVAYLDLATALTTGDTPATAVKGGSYFSVAADRFRGLPSQVPMFYWNSATDYGAVGGFPRLSVGVSALADDDIVVKVGTNTVSAFAKGAKNGSAKYVEQVIGYENRPFDPSGADAFGNADLWRLKHMYETDANVSALSFSRSRILANGGEITGAWLEQGAADYIGGYHGDEVKTFAALLLDGVEIAFNNVTTLVGKKLEFVQHSKLYRCNTQTEIATHSQRIELTRAEGGLQIELTQRVIWGAAVTLSASMMTMLPIKRLLDDTSGVVITDTAMRAPYAGVEDVSVTGFPQIATLGELPDSQLWGPTGISARATILQHPGFADCGFFVSNASFYNKLYYSVAGSTVSGMGGVVHNTVPGERWDVKSVIHVTTNL